MVDKLVRVCNRDFKCVELAMSGPDDAMSVSSLTSSASMIVSSNDGTDYEGEYAGSTAATVVPGQRYFKHPPPGVPPVRFFNQPPPGNPGALFKVPPPKAPFPSTASPDFNGPPLKAEPAATGPPVQVKAAPAMLRERMAKAKQMVRPPWPKAMPAAVANPVMLAPAANISDPVHRTDEDLITHQLIVAGTVCKYHRDDARLVVGRGRWHEWVQVESLLAYHNVSAFDMDPKLFRYHATSDLVRMNNMLFELSLSYT